MSAAPIFLVKRRLDNPVLDLAYLTCRYGVVPRMVLPDVTHWGLEVRGKYYHLKPQGVSPLELDTTDMSASLLSFKLGGRRRKKHRVGMTRMSDEEIKQAGMTILKNWKCEGIKYDPVFWNCHRFTGCLLGTIYDWQRPTDKAVLRSLPGELLDQLYLCNPRQVEDDILSWHGSPFTVSITVTVRFR